MPRRAAEALKLSTQRPSSSVNVKSLNSEVPSEVFFDGIVRIFAAVPVTDA